MADNTYLNDEQQAQLQQMLNGAQQPAQEQPSPEATPPVEDSGEAPAVDAAAAMPATPQEANPQPQVDPALAELGVQNVAELVELYKNTIGQSNQYKQMLSQLLAFQQALDTKQELEPNDPLNTVKKAVREEMAPIYEKLQTEAKNKLVQEAWGKDAVNMPDLTDMMPEITAFIQEHPELAVADDGLRRAYDGVRSKNYRSEKQLFADKDFVSRAASNEKVKEAVIQEYLANAARNGDNVPASISGGGSTPLTGKKQAPSSMQQAKDGLAKMLGMK